MITRIVVAISLGLAAAGCGSAAPPPPPFKPVVDTKTLMLAMLEGPADVVWQSTGTTITESGIEEFQPQSNEDWTRVRNAAITVTEAGNLLMLPPRAQDGERWMRAAAGLIAQGERMIAAIDRRSAKDVFDVGSDLYDACVTCHVNYMPGVKEMYR
jgi:hypothetical protein